MRAVATILPVFVMLVLGVLMRVTGTVTPEQKQGARDVVFKVMFPVMIFHIFFTSEFRGRYILAISYVVAVYTAGYLIGVFLRNWHGKKYADISPFIIPTVEGGAVSIPLYITFAGTERAINMVMFDPGGVIFCFVIMQILIARKRAMQVSGKELALSLLKTPIMIAMILGITLNLAGVHRFLESTGSILVYDGVSSMIMAPITGIILFVLGYDLRVNLQMLRALGKLLVTRIAFMAAVVGGIYLLFSDMVKDPYFVAAIWLYFMTPTGFMVPILLSDLCKDEDDHSFMSAFISLVLIITMVVYVFFAARLSGNP